MKKLLLLLLILLISPFTASYTNANTATATSTVATITEIMNTMAGYGVFGTDVAKERIAYYSDKIYLYGVEMTSVFAESEAWARNELSNVLKKRLLVLKDQGYLTKERYDSYSASYEALTKSELSIRLGNIYKDFLRFEQEVIYTEIPLMQDALYEKFKAKLAALLKANLITQEKHDTWLVKIDIQVYQYKSDPDFMATAFDEEASKYTTPIVPCAPCSTTCNSSSSSTPSSANCTIIQETANADYTAKVKAQYEKQYARLSLKNLKLTLTRTRKLEAKYAAGSKNKLKAQAMIEVLNKEITKKSVVPVKK